MRRLAIYYAPPEDSALARTAAEWLGRDAFTGTVLPPPENGFSRQVWEAATMDPRVYGFHATLKPPFRLAEGVSEEELRDRLSRFAASRQAFQATFELGSLSRFLALVLTEPCPDFTDLASACVKEFDGFRAPPAESELTRRRARLTPSQLVLLEQWGYPFVMDEWRFHMTLTSSLGPETYRTMQAHLTALFEPHCQQPLCIDSLCLFAQPGSGVPFQLVERFRFR